MHGNGSSLKTLLSEIIHSIHLVLRTEYSHQSWVNTIGADFLLKKMIFPWRWACMVNVFSKKKDSNHLYHDKWLIVQVYCCVLIKTNKYTNEI